MLTFSSEYKNEYTSSIPYIAKELQPKPKFKQPLFCQTLKKTHLHNVAKNLEPIEPRIAGGVDYTFSYSVV